MRNTILAILGISLCLGWGCSPEDRSSEQPFKPTVCTKECLVEADSCLLSGQVTLSPNSSLKACGFIYGNDTLKLETISKVPKMVFSAYTRALSNGTYYAVAFAENGVGKTIATDTLHFTIAQ